AALRDLRRAFHTLKGSGRMVGAQRIGEFSWSIESLLNRVISQTLLRSPDILSIVRDAVAAMPQLIDEIDGGELARIDIAAIMARADALSGREGRALPATAVPAPLPEPAAAEQRAAGTAAAPLEEPAMDPVLREIFRKETAGHILVVRQFLERCARGVAPHLVSEALYRACHTLSGIAKTAGARQGIKVAEPMEHYVRKLFDNGHGMSSDALELLHDTVRLLETVSEHVDENTGFFPEQTRLTAGWVALDRQLDAELARLADAAERTLAQSWEPGMPAAPDLSLIIDDAAAVPDEELMDLALPPLTDAALAARAAAPFNPPWPEDDETGFDDEFDADIAAIFGEEATELLEQSEAAFGRWRADRADRAQVTELKRLLHTLKGGARMAGIRTMGDLSHEVESFLAAIESGQLAADAAAFDVLQSSLDELHRMRELAKSGQRLPSARELILRIQALAALPATVALVEPVLAPAPIAPAAEFIEGAVVTPAVTEHVAVEPDMAAELPVEEIVLETPQAEAPAEPAVELAEETVATAAEEDIAAIFAEELLPAAEVVAVGTEQPAAEPTAAVASEEPSELPAVAAAAAVPVTPPEFEHAPAAPGRPVEAAVPQPARFVVPPPSQVPATYEVAATAHTPVLPGREPVAPTERGELARVDADLLDDLLNNAGEVSIFRARIEQQMTSIEFNLAELDRTVTRLREQLRKLEMETEAQILNKHQTDDRVHRADFDPLELDRYSNIQQLSRALAESVSDVASIEGLLAQLNRDTQNLL
ncbi:MAG: Hpt domain-containing protein, partial [Steroidobacteraceae bacterium]